MQFTNSQAFKKSYKPISLQKEYIYTSCNTKPTNMMYDPQSKANIHLNIKKI